jgi:hypothetical protein
MMNSRVPRIFVATAFSGENEFPESCMRLRQQRDVEIVEHFIVHSLGVLEALRLLYARWNEVKDTCDMFVQLDPDMVLRSDRVFSVIWQTFLEHQTHNFIQCPVFDYLTQKNIWGLNAYLPSVEFPVPQSRKFPDRETYNKKRLDPNVLPPDLNPAADHSPNPSSLQAFHFGWHRTLRLGKISNLSKETQRKSDSRQSLALAGEYMAQEHLKLGRSSEDVDYSNEFFIKAYIQACKLTNHQ